MIFWTALFQILLIWTVLCFCGTNKARTIPWLYNVCDFSNTLHPQYSYYYSLWYHDDSTKDNDLHPIMLRPLPNAILSHCDLQRSCLYWGLPRSLISLWHGNFMNKNRIYYHLLTPLKMCLSKIALVFQCNNIWLHNIDHGVFRIPT